MSATLIDLIGVHLTYGSGRRRVEAVRGVSGAIREGATLALVGPSGSGKSSLLHLIAGLESPTSGSVHWPRWGRPRIDPTLVGLMFQSASLVPSLDALENVALPLVLHGVPDAEAGERAAETMALLGLDALARALPEDLSGGQAQRVNLARALTSRPPILLADEPTGQLDHRTADEVLDVVLQAVSDGGLTLVISTHDDRVVRRMGERWELRDGRLQQPGAAT